MADTEDHEPKPASDLRSLAASKKKGMIKEQNMSLAKPK